MPQPTPSPILIAEILAVLREVESYLDDRADGDWDQDGIIPNTEMRLLIEVQEAIAKATEL